MSRRLNDVEFPASQRFGSKTVRVMRWSLAQLASDGTFVLLLANNLSRDLSSLVLIQALAHLWLGGGK